MLLPYQLHQKANQQEQNQLSQYSYISKLRDKPFWIWRSLQDQLTTAQAVRKSNLQTVGKCIRNPVNLSLNFNLL